MPAQRELLVTDRYQRSYTRTITSRPVEFTCQRCGKDSSREQFPGKRPKYCPVCQPTIEAEQNAARQRRYRERQQVTVTSQQVTVTEQVPVTPPKQVGVTESGVPRNRRPARKKPKVTQRKRGK